MHVLVDRSIYKFIGLVTNNTQSLFHNGYTATIYRKLPLCNYYWWFLDTSTCIIIIIQLPLTLTVGVRGFFLNILFIILFLAPLLLDLVLPDNCGECVCEECVW